MFEWRGPDRRSICGLPISLLARLLFIFCINSKHHPDLSLRDKLNIFYREK